MGKRKIHLNQNDIVNLMIEKFEHRFMVSQYRGTYNRQDPTQFVRTKCKIYMEYGWKTDSPPDPLDIEDASGVPMPETVDVDLHDVTWGIEVKIHNSLGEFRGYWNRACAPGKDGRWCRCSPGFMEVLRRLYLEGEKEPKEMDEESDHLHPFE